VAVWLHSDDFPDLRISNKRILKNWINCVIQSFGKATGEINIIFLNDEKLLEINKNYLKHDFYTDVITFDYSTKKFVSGDIYLSVDRIEDNYVIHKTDFNKECLRVIIHGVLHLLELKDKAKDEKEMMRKEENRHLDSVKAALIFSK